MALLVALIAVTNFFLAAALDRRRTIGLLRSVAYTPRQITRMLATEAAVLGALGGLLAVAYALPLSILVVTRTARIVSGWSFHPDLSVVLAAATVALAIGSSLLGSYFPARRIARANLAAQMATE